MSPSGERENLERVGQPVTDCLFELPSVWGPHSVLGSDFGPGVKEFTEYLYRRVFLWYCLFLAALLFQTWCHSNRFISLNLIKSWISPSSHWIQWLLLLSLIAVALYCLHWMIPVTWPLIRHVSDLSPCESGSGLIWIDQIFVSTKMWSSQTNLIRKRQNKCIRSWKVLSRYLLTQESFNSSYSTAFTASLQVPESHTQRGLSPQLSHKAHDREKRCSCENLKDRECVYFCHIGIVWVNTPRYMTNTD